MKGLLRTKTSFLTRIFVTTTHTPIAVQRRWFVLANSTMAPVRRDPNTLSNYDVWQTKHTTANFTLDFAAKCLRGSVILELEAQTDGGSREVVLDSSYVDVSAVEADGTAVKWDIKSRVGANGCPMHISLPDNVSKGAVVKLEISVVTTAECTALQWLTPAQTSNKKAPFMFSQCQAIHARSLFPCQDTPDVKSTYDFNITSPYVVVASGLAAGVEDKGEEKLYRFNQKVPIPSYLFALASGDIVTAPIGKRSLVATGPNELKESQWELEADMDKYMVSLSP